LLSILADEHRQILATLEELVAALRRIPPIGAEEITRMRVRFGNLARRHLLAEEEFIFRPLLETGLIHSLPQVKSIMQEMRAEWATYSVNIREWTLPAILADRAGYLRQMEQRLAILRDWNAREEEQVYAPALAALAAHASRMSA
jgi:hypothetical protein